MIAISVNLADGGASAALASVISSLTGPQALELSEQAGIGARNAAIKYHREFDQAGGWKGKRYLGNINSDGTSFGSLVASGWLLQSFSATGATISNDAPFYAHKVEGGTIRPIKAKSLTIPMIPEAKGIRASVYSQNTGNKLFTIKGGKALFERIDSLTTGSRGRRNQPGTSQIKTSGIRAVYALVSSITQGPWSGAVPPEDVIGGAYVETYRDGLIGFIEKL